MARRSLRLAPGVPVAGAMLVISRLRISQYCWSCSFTVEVTRLAPSIRGRAPLPYEDRMIGLPEAPEPLGHSCPDHTCPAFSRIWSPALKVVALTLASDFHGAAVLVPALESLPPVASR